MTGKFLTLPAMILLVGIPQLWKRMYEHISPMMSILVSMLLCVFAFLSWSYIPERVRLEDIICLLVLGTLNFGWLRYPIRRWGDDGFSEMRRDKVSVIDDLLFAYGYTQCYFSVIVSLMILYNA